MATSEVRGHATPSPLFTQLIVLRLLQVIFFWQLFDFIIMMHHQIELPIDYSYTITAGGHVSVCLASAHRVIFRKLQMYIIRYALAGNRASRIKIGCSLAGCRHELDLQGCTGVLVGDFNSMSLSTHCSKLRTSEFLRASSHRFSAWW